MARSAKRRAAATLGLPAEKLAHAADDERLLKAGVRALLAVHADGVFGVPFFVRGYEKFWGWTGFRRSSGR